MIDEQFWALVRETSSGCWEWQGTRVSLGYGRVSRRRLRRSPIPAHRYAWFLTHGVMPAAGVFVCHACDNPPCCNPAHLFLGLAADNNADRDAKGRGVNPPLHVGVAHPLVSRDDATVRAARLDYANGRGTTYEIAARYGVSQATVMSWIRGRTRRAAGGPLGSAAA